MHYTVLGYRFCTVPLSQIHVRSAVTRSRHVQHVYPGVTWLLTYTQRGHVSVKALSEEMVVLVEFAHLLAVLDGVVLRP